MIIKLHTVHKVKGLREMRLTIENSFLSFCRRDAERCFKNENNRGSTSVFLMYRGKSFNKRYVLVLECLTVVEAALNQIHITFEKEIN